MDPSFTCRTDKQFVCVNCCDKFVSSAPRPNVMKTHYFHIKRSCYSSFSARRKKNAKNLITGNVNISMECVGRHFCDFSSFHSGLKSSTFETVFMGNAKIEQDGLIYVDFEIK